MNKERGGFLAAEGNKDGVRNRRSLNACGADRG